MMFVLLATLILSETHPSLTWQKCSGGGCTSQTGYIVTDAEVRGSATEDVDYEAQLGVTTSGGTLKQKLVTTYNGKKNIGSRLYLLASDEKNYELFNFVGKEISYDVDLSDIPCGVNAAFYTVEMPKAGSGGGGAEYGTGYCDANYVGGTGCAEFDIQEANNQAMVYTSHPCQSLGQTSTSGQCLADGCGFNAYRYGAKTFWGSTVNPKQKVTVVTQFLGSGSLTEIRRLYVQGGKVIPNAMVTVYNTGDFDSITEKFCTTAGHAVDGWKSLAHMGESFDKGHVIVFSLWDSNDMGWLDGSTEYGPCGNPAKDDIEAQNPGMTLTWSNLKFGDIDSTY